MKKKIFKPFIEEIFYLQKYFHNILTSEYTLTVNSSTTRAIVRQVNKVKTKWTRSSYFHRKLIFPQVKIIILQDPSHMNSK